MAALAQQSALLDATLTGLTDYLGSAIAVDQLLGMSFAGLGAIQD